MREAKKPLQSSSVSPSAFDLNPAETSLFLSLEVIGQGGGGGCWPEQQRLRGVEMLFELAQGSALETPGIVNKEKSESSGRPPTSLALQVA